KLGTVLVDQNGFTLYRFTQDSRGMSSCTGACASLWPPLMAPSGARLRAGARVDTAKLGVITRSGGGRQVTYGGDPLYRFSGDKQPGQAHGQGIAGVWFV